LTTEAGMCDEPTIAATARYHPVLCCGPNCGTPLGERGPHQVQGLAWAAGWITDEDGDWLCPNCQAAARCREDD